jgi:hypothetical protein
VFARYSFSVLISIYLGRNKEISCILPHIFSISLAVYLFRTEAKQHKKGIELLCSASENSKSLEGFKRIVWPVLLHKIT